MQDAEVRAPLGVSREEEEEECEGGVESRALDECAERVAVRPVCGVREEEEKGWEVVPSRGSQPLRIGILNIVSQNRLCTPFCLFSSYGLK